MLHTLKMKALFWLLCLIVSTVATAQQQVVYGNTNDVQFQSGVLSSGAQYWGVAGAGGNTKYNYCVESLTFRHAP
jgi:hypothetical protein